MATYRLLSLSGSYSRYVSKISPSGSFSKSQVGITPAPVVGNLNVRRFADRKWYNRKLLGLATMADIGQSGLPGTDPTQQHATVPSWTQKNIGFDHSFYLPAFSASQHEVSSLNCYASSSIPLEVNPVPASGTLFYEKNTRFKKIVYTAQAQSNVFLNTDDGFQFAIFSGTGAETFHPISGTTTTTNLQYYAGQGTFANVRNNPFGNSVWIPWVINVNVPDYGKIRDIKVWVELIGFSRTTFAPSSSTDFTSNAFLANLVLGIRSPNIAVKSGIPIANDPRNPYAGNAGSVTNLFPFTFYPLWIGAALACNFNINVQPGTNFPYFFTGSNPGWFFDSDMRCRFTDSAPKSTNPFFLNQLYNDPYSASLGTVVLLSGNSPNYVGITKYGTTGNLTPTYSGAFYPWFVDTRIPTMNLATSANQATISASTAPVGWLNGPFVSGTQQPAPGEWPTSPQGNLGPTDVFPCYGLLDDVFQETINYDSRLNTLFAQAYSGTFRAATVDTTRKFRGFRPGLRGSEVHGNWQFLFAGPGIVFRQVRFEFLIDTGQPASLQTKGQQQRYNKTSAVSERAGLPHIIGVMSGVSDTFDFGTQLLYSVVPEQYARTIGITDDTGSFSNFAVFTRMTGVLAARLAASASLAVSGTAGALYSYLHNQFGTPFIPISSGSSLSPAFQYFDSTSAPSRALISEIISPRPLIPPAQNLRSTLSRLPIFKTMVDAMNSRILALQSSSLS